jgi:formylmethanofuran dehydrogenase subunit E
MKKTEKEVNKKCPKCNGPTVKAYGVMYRGRYVCPKCNKSAFRKCGKCGDLWKDCAC